MARREADGVLKASVAHQHTCKRTYKDTLKDTWLQPRQLVLVGDVIYKLYSLSLINTHSTPHLHLHKTVVNQ